MKISSPLSQQSSSIQQKNLAPYKEIAQNLESGYIKFLLEEMEKTIPREEEQSGEMNFYKSLLNNEYADLMAKKDGGLGLQKIILPQIVPEHLKRELGPSEVALGVKKYQNQINSND